MGGGRRRGMGMGGGALTWCAGAVDGGEEEANGGGAWLRFHPSYRGVLQRLNKFFVCVFVSVSTDGQVQL
uniref:Uncharacterized protein n=1 Tax=Oryza brachyantha TaxID=4533 RepID=J3MWX0_ORYBR